MNRPPSVFVSSTCYDLKQVRADIKGFLEGLGLEPLLSEYNSFPIDPDLGTVENCLKMVESKADIFLLIVGGRYGQQVDRGKSVTNLEFLTAGAKGIPKYVFVMRCVLDILPVWKVNPSVDFSAVVDSPGLLEFVSDLYSSGETWVLPFETAQDICAALRVQLAYLFADALQLRLRASAVAGSALIASLRGRALRLAIERPPYWEYLLFAEALSDELRKYGDLRRDWDYRVVLGSLRTLKAAEFFEWVSNKWGALQRIVSTMNTLVEGVLREALGPPGTAGDPERILYVAKTLAAAYASAIQWGLEFHRLAVPEELDRLRLLASTCCANLIREVEEFAEELRRAINEAVHAVRPGEKRTASVTLTLTVPDMTDLEKEIGRLGPLYRDGILDWS